MQHHLMQFLLLPYLQNHRLPRQKRLGFILKRPLN